MKIVFMASGTINSSLSYRPLSLAKELVKYHHDVYILAPGFDKYSHYRVEKTNEIDGVKILNPLQPPFLPFQLSLLFYSISSLYHLIKLNPDVIHIFKANPITIQCLLLKLIRQVVILLDVDDLDVEVMEIEKSPKIMIELVKISNCLALKFSDGTTCASKFLYKQYVSQYKNKKTAYISNGADFTGIVKLPSKLNNKRSIVFIGNMNRKNILEPLFYAVKTLVEQKVEVHVKIIGNGKFLKYFKTLTKKLYLSKNIIFIGYVSQKHLNKYISVGDLGYCYMPNERTIKACSSMKVFQYMQFGVIPLVSNVGDLPMYAFQGKAGYIVKSDNTKLLAEAINVAIEDKKSVTEKMQYAMKYARYKYSWSTLAITLNNFYNIFL